jgi:acid stress-induced BolA-like protein IbaG/YrbA
MIDIIKSCIEEALPDTIAYITDPMNDQTHFEAIVVSKCFEGKVLVKQHQLVMNSLKKAFDSEAVHALKLKTYTPEKWAAQKNS